MAPPALKSISPYLQRAEELRTKEPIVAYWCTYYAAQIGISLKAKDTASRDFLLHLLGELERMKQEIGPTDAIDVEAASSAYVENFALRVFAAADNEDRSGNVTRSTAKKFLAAAHFLEVLKTFPKSEVSESSQEKIRYAKWKAADIAKAFREGRKPTPGPADSGIEAELAELQATAAAAGRSSPDSIDTLKETSLPQISEPAPIKRTSPKLESADITNANRRFSSQNTHPAFVDPTGLHPSPDRGGAVSPGQWSTVATPGTNVATPEVFARTESEYSGDLLDPPPGNKKTVHFTPSVDGMSSPSEDATYSPYDDPASFGGPSSLHQPPIPPVEYPRPSAPPLPLPHVPAPVIPPPPSFVLPPTIVSPPPLQLELTPTLVAKAQKHCRFAISSLDYEDAEQARRELRAALALLGG